MKPSRALIESVCIRTHQIHDLPIRPTDLIVTGLLLLHCLELFCTRGYDWLARVNATSTSSTGNPKRLGIDHRNYSCTSLTANNHAMIHELVCGDRGNTLHNCDTESEADTFSDMGASDSLFFSNIGIDGKPNEISISTLEYAFLGTRDYVLL